jgi:hypothetical protein
VLVAGPAVALALVGLLAACGGSGAKPAASTSSPRTEVEHPCADATLDIPRGREIDLSACGANAEATVTDPSQILNKLGTLVFIARAAGDATIDVVGVPPCQTGQQCSNARQQLAHIVVKVS